MAYEGKRMVINDESLNSYGSRVLSSGWMNRADFEKNPIMLYNHREAWRGQTTEMLPIGYWKDFELANGKITAIPVIDDEDESTGKVIAGKMKRGVLRAASMGIRIVKLSSDPKDLLPDQTRPTVTGWKMREISIVDIPSNANAVCLYDEAGGVINLSDSSNAVLPKLEITNKSQSKMNELKIVAGFLGLNDTATLADVQKKIASLNTQAEQAASLGAQLKDFQTKEQQRLKDHANEALEQAVKDERIRADQKEFYAGFVDKDPQGFEKLLSTLPVQQNLSDFTETKPADRQGESLTFEGKTFDEIFKLNDDGATMKRWKESDMESYKAAFKAKYNREYKG